MSNDARPKRRPPKKLAALLLLWGFPLKAVAVGATMTATLAALAVLSTSILTNPDVVEELAFDAGGINLTVSTNSNLVTMTTPAMTPGDSYTAPFTVGNSGNVELRYAMASTTTEDILAGELLLTIKSEVNICDDADWDSSGTIIYRGVLGSTASSTILGSAAPGPDLGDRPMSGAADEVLCFNVALPFAASNAAQGTTSTATFTFFAEQVVESD